MVVLIWRLHENIGKKILIYLILIKITRNYFDLL